MPGPKLVLPRTVDWWKVSPFVETFDLQTQNLGTASITAPVLTAIERMQFRSAKFVPATANVTGTTTTITLVNFTQSRNLTLALSLTGDAANVALNFVPNNAANGGNDANMLILPGDVIQYAYVFGTATVGPGFAAITMEVALSGRYK
jgi:hypothetical protein